MPRVAAVRALEPFNIWLRFTDGREGVVSLDDLFSRGGVFEPLRDPVEFAKVRVERGFGTIEWPGPSEIETIDLDPEVLYAKVSELAIREGSKLD